MSWKGEFLLKQKQKPVDNHYYQYQHTVQISKATYPQNNNDRDNYDEKLRSQQKETLSKHSPDIHSMELFLYRTRMVHGNDSLSEHKTIFL